MRLVVSEGQLIPTAKPASPTTADAEFEEYKAVCRRIGQAHRELRQLEDDRARLYASVMRTRALHNV